jgi:oxygen-independent coproporphyrinogen-3 oxidase
MFELKRFKLAPKSVDTLYFGGGTPSSVDFSLYKKIFDLLAPYLCDDAEITFEANPNSATSDWLQGVLEYGCNRISIGIQSFDEEKLRFLGRVHSSQQAKDAVLRAHEIGFDNISIDIIYDTPFDNEEFVKDELSIALELPISHLSAYSLTIEENSAFKGKVDLKNENLDSAKIIFDALNQNGFLQYEVSSFGKKLSRHNMAYWHMRDYIGVGAGAVGFLGNKRFYPQVDIGKYISNPFLIEEELISTDELRFERLFLGLRSIIGINEIDIKKQNIQRIDELMKHKKMDKKNGRLIATDFLLADEIALYLEG